MHCYDLTKTSSTLIRRPRCDLDGLGVRTSVAGGSPAACQAPSCAHVCGAILGVGCIDRWGLGGCSPLASRGLSGQSKAKSCQPASVRRGRFWRAFGGPPRPLAGLCSNGRLEARFVGPIGPAA